MRCAVQHYRSGVTTTTSTCTDGGSSSGLSTAVIVGIAVGGGFGTLMLFALVVLVVNRRQRVTRVDAKACAGEKGKVKEAGVKVGKPKGKPGKESKKKEAWAGTSTAC